MIKLTTSLVAFLIVIFLTIPFLPPLAQASPPTRTNSDSVILKHYLQIQEALASDNLIGVSEAAHKIEKASPAEAVKNAAHKLGEAKDIAQARDDLKPLSNQLVQWAKKTKPTGIVRAYCPMAEARWLQKRGGLRNPYYGKEMLDCGVVETN